MFLLHLDQWCVRKYADWVPPPPPPHQPPSEDNVVQTVCYLREGTLLLIPAKDKTGAVLMTPDLTVRMHSHESAPALCPCVPVKVPTALVVSLPPQQ